MIVLPDSDGFSDDLSSAAGAVFFVPSRDYARLELRDVWHGSLVLGLVKAASPAVPFPARGAEARTGLARDYSAVTAALAPA